jgi:hypothetical protein
MGDVNIATECSKCAIYRRFNKKMVSMVRENIKEYLADLHAKFQWRPTGASFRVQEE